MFANALGVERILGPAIHSFSRYDDLLETALQHDKSKLVLIAMGPTAKALAYELALAGFQAIDIGNLDIEYEWFKMGATERVAIEGKYTSEAIGGRVVADIQNSTYEQQIVAKFT